MDPNEDRPERPQREFHQEYPSTVTEAAMLKTDRDRSPVQILLEENAVQLEKLNALVSDLKSRVRTITSSRLRADESAKIAAGEPTAPRLGSSEVIDALYNEQDSIKRAQRGIGEVLETLEV